MQDTENQHNKRNFFGGFASGALLLWDFLKVIIIALLIIIPIRYFVFQPFIVSGSSMVPNFYDKQYLIIDEISYRFSDPQRGNVVVLKYPRDHKQFFIKRIIGLPNEKIKIDEGKITIFNDQNPEGLVLEEDYLPNGSLTYPHDPLIVGGKKIITLASDEYLALGDNRLFSSDSRDWGPVKRSEIVGKVVVRALPLSEFKIYTKGPTY